MGGNTYRAVASMLVNPVNASDNQQCTTYVCDAHVEALGLQQSYIVGEHDTANLVVPRGNTISAALGTPPLVPKTFLLRFI
jgi:hypothetical protein